MSAMSAAAVLLLHVHKRYAICHRNGSALLGQSSISCVCKRKRTPAEVKLTHMNVVIDITDILLNVRLLCHMST